MLELLLTEAAGDLARLNPWAILKIKCTPAVNSNAVCGEGVQFSE